MTPPELLYHDAHVLALHKPTAMAVHPGDSPREPMDALRWARRLAGRFVYPAHRLDRATSGVLLFALDPEGARQLQASWEEAHKHYVALVRGVLPIPCVVDHPLASEPGAPRRPAVTEVEPLSVLSVGAAGQAGADDGLGPRRYGLVAARPHHGRRHQIRRHLKHLSHPVIGDVTHGKGDHNRRFRALGLARLALHAVALTVPHPAGTGLLRLFAPLPDDLAEPLERLGVSPLDPVLRFEPAAADLLAAARPWAGDLAPAEGHWFALADGSDPIAVTRLAEDTVVLLRVAPAHRRRGLGRRILKRLEGRLRAAGHDRARMWAPAAAEGFLRAAGWEPAGREAGPGERQWTRRLA